MLPQLLCRIVISGSGRVNTVWLPSSPQATDVGFLPKVILSRRGPHACNIRETTVVCLRGTLLECVLLQGMHLTTCLPGPGSCPRTTTSRGSRPPSWNPKCDLPGIPNATCPPPLRQLPTEILRHAHQYRLTV